jgi:hypothetical protein
MKKGKEIEITVYTVQLYSEKSRNREKKGRLEVRILITQMKLLPLLEGRFKTCLRHYLGWTTSRASHSRATTNPFLKHC